MKINSKGFCIVVVLLLIFSNICSVTAHAVEKKVYENLSPDEEYYLAAQLSEFIKQMHENPNNYIDPKTGKLMDELTAFRAHQLLTDTRPEPVLRSDYMEKIQREQQEQRNRQIQAYIAAPTIPWTPNLYEQLATQERTVPKTEGQQDKTWDKFVTVSTNQAISYAVINSGTILSAMLLTGLNSDLPGHLLAQVSENVYDSPTGKIVLIPQGSRLFGEYDSKVLFGQKRALIKWNRLIYPDGSVLGLQGMAGADKAGYAGFKGKVDNHFGPMFGSAMMVSVFAGLANEYGKDKTTIQLFEPRVVIGDTTPVGTIVEWPNNQAPTNYILFDGSSFDSDLYPELAALLGGDTLPTVTASPGTYRIIKAQSSSSSRSFGLGTSTNVVNESGNAVGEELSKTLATMAEKLMEKYLELAPTLTINPGYRFSVICNQEIVLPVYISTWHTQ